jgi:hypothetical protein
MSYRSFYAKSSYAKSSYAKSSPCAKASARQDGGQARAAGKRKIRHDTLDTDQRRKLERDLAAERNRARMERVAAIRHRAAGDAEAAADCDDRANDAQIHADSIASVLARFAAARPVSFRRHSREGGNPRSTDSKRKNL